MSREVMYALRLARPAAVAEPVASFDYRRLSDLHFALRAADEAVQMARGLPRRPELAELVANRDSAVVEALAELKKVMGDD